MLLCHHLLFDWVFKIENQRALFFCLVFAVVFRSSLLISRSLVVGLLAFVIMVRMAITQTPWEMQSFLSNFVLHKSSSFYSKHMLS